MKKSDFKIVEERGLFHLLRRKVVKGSFWCKPVDDFFCVNNDGHFTGYDPEWGWMRGKPYSSKNINEIRERVAELIKDTIYHEV